MAIISSLKKEQAAGMVRAIYKEFEEQSGNAPEWVKVMAHRPEILKEFIELFRIIMEQGDIESYLKWKIAYVVSDTLKCEFCVDVTIKMLKKLGISDELLTDIKNAQDLPEQEKEILILVKDVTLDGHLDNPQILEKLKEKLTEPQIVEIVSVIGLFNYINRFNNTFAILPE
jgi:uncharacterized peroxidase-related enzyme